LKLVNLTRKPIEIKKDGETILIVEPDGRLPYTHIREVIQDPLLIEGPDDIVYEIPCINKIICGVILSNDIESGITEELPPYQEDILYLASLDAVTTAQRADFAWITGDTNTFLYKIPEQKE
jgi:hypothetical protein